MLKITISGPSGCGKTTVAKVIEEKLRELGFNAFVDDVDRVSPEEIQTRLTVLTSQRNQVLISVKQEQRRSITGEYLSPSYKQE